jgi:Tol biopolymer transport system component
MFFQSNRSGAVKVYSASRNSASDVFGNVALVGGVSSSSDPWKDETPFIREDGKALYFSSNRSGEDDLYRAVRNGATFGAPVLLAELASPGFNALATVTPNDLTIYWASGRTGSVGNTDIWMATRSDPSGTFGAPKNVVELNTPAYEFPSFVTRDGCTLYFTNDTNGEHIFVATRGK